MKKLALFGLAGSFAYGRMRSRIIDLVYQDTEFNRYLIEKTKALREEYEGTWFLPFRFMEIYYCSLFDPRPEIGIKEERIQLKHQDTLNLDWANLSAGIEDNPNLRIALVLGPVNGANNCKYTNHIMTQLQKEGYRVVFKHYKNFKLKHNENNEIEPQPKYSFVDFTSVDDLDQVMKHIHGKYPEAPVYMVGYSMGAIQSMMWLSKNKEKQDFVKGFVSLSCPIDLSKASPRLSQYQHYIYAWWMTSALKKIAHYHRDLVESKGIHIDYKKINSCTTPVEFDTIFSCTVLGYSHLDDFYKKVSCYESFKDLNVPTLLILSKDDPTYTLDFYPWEDIKANKNIIAAITPRGAHGHFVVGNNLTRWFKKPMSDFLNAVDERSKAPPKQ